MRFSYFFILTFSRSGRCLSLGEENYESNFTIWDSVVVLASANQEIVESDLKMVFCSEQWVRFARNLENILQNWTVLKFLNACIKRENATKCARLFSTRRSALLSPRRLGKSRLEKFLKL